MQGIRTISCSVVAIRLTCELQGTREAEADAVIAVGRGVVAPVGRPALQGVVAPITAAKHAHTLWKLTLKKTKMYIQKNFEAQSA